jgi:HPr kinase/phosphorylase
VRRGPQESDQLIELTVRDLFEEKGLIYGLKLLSKEGGLEKSIQTKEIHRPGLALAGFTDRFSHYRIQILGETEITYLKGLSPDNQKKSITNFFAFDIPCVVVTKGLEPPSSLVDEANRHGVPVISTSQNTSRFSHFLSAYLDNRFAPQTTLHGTLADVYGVGLLFQGRSGIGKSECVLDLVERGHRLVADDLVKVVRRGNEVLIGKGHESLRHHMEIRGLGIIDITSIFGIRAVRLQKRIEVVVLLEEWKDDFDYDRTGLDENMTTIIDVQLPVVTIPLVPGKNITVLSEVAAMNHLIKLYGHHPARQFNERLVELTRRREDSVAEYLDLEEDYE